MLQASEGRQHGRRRVSLRKLGVMMTKILESIKIPAFIVETPATAIIRKRFPDAKVARAKFNDPMCLRGKVIVAPKSVIGWHSENSRIAEIRLELDNSRGADLMYLVIPPSQSGSRAAGVLQLSSNQGFYFFQLLALPEARRLVEKGRVEFEPEGLEDYVTLYYDVLDMVSGELDGSRLKPLYFRAPEYYLAFADADAVWGKAYLLVYVERIGGDMEINVLGPDFKPLSKFKVPGSNFSYVLGYVPIPWSAADRFTVVKRVVEEAVRAAGSLNHIYEELYRQVLGVYIFAEQFIKA